MKVIALHFVVLFKSGIRFKLHLPGTHDPSQ
jgi:hypothetical protein